MLHTSRSVVPARHCPVHAGCLQPFLEAMWTGSARGPAADRPEFAGAMDAEDAGSPIKAPFRVLLYSLQRHTYRHELTFSSPVQALRWALHDTSCCCAVLLLTLAMCITHRW